MANNLSIPWENIKRRYSRYYVYIEPVVSDPLIRGYFSLVASIMLVAFFLIFALSPTINTILVLTKKISEQRSTIKILDQKIADLVTAQANYAQIENSLPILFTAVPTSPTPQTIISGVNSAASASGVPLMGLQFRDLPLSADAVTADQEQVVAPINLPVVNFTLATAESMDKIRDFLTRVENSPRLIHIANLVISTGNGLAGDSVSVSAVGYYLSETL